ncbi:DUF1835 domain-containing protein [Aeromonas veronii]|uniref:DUF1835 domain-containing protein n=1 Tax=Aeromonas veronii TaxID=654 RepID=UPI001C5BB1C8|nr:DUF1835 domain-containing protein [Aeromonas veronii]MBW3781444.1 DUF1835 domain-containing protein [Aeromonas veronii]
MMDNFFHICWGDAAYGCLKERNRLLGDSSDIFGVLDDFQVGLLVDADSLNPTLRLRLFEEVLSSQQWYEQVRECKSTLIKSQLNNHKSFLKILNNTKTKIIWVGNTVCNKLMLAMISYLSMQSTKLMVVDITNKVGVHCDHIFDISFLSPNDLLNLYPTELSLREREELSKLWLYWRGNANGLRQIDKNGNIIDYSFECIDRLILDNINCKDKSLSIDIVSEIASEVSNIIPLNILYWRLKVLRTNQILAFQ